MIIINGRNLWPQDIEHIAERRPELRSIDASAFLVSAKTTRKSRWWSSSATSTMRRRGGGRPAAHREIHEDLGVSCLIELVPRHTLPRTSSGKLSRAAARDDYLQRRAQERGRPARRRGRRRRTASKEASRRRWARRRPQSTGSSLQPLKRAFVRRAHRGDRIHRQCGALAPDRRRMARARALPPAGRPHAAGVAGRRWVGAISIPTNRCACSWRARTPSCIVPALSAAPARSVRPRQRGGRGPPRRSCGSVSQRRDSC